MHVEFENLAVGASGKGGSRAENFENAQEATRTDKVAARLKVLRIFPMLGL